MRVLSDKLDLETKQPVGLVGLQGMRNFAHLYWCVWNMDGNDSSFVEANDLHIRVDVDTDIQTLVSQGYVDNPLWIRISGH